MKIFACPDCGQTLYFENALCEHCALDVGYAPHADAMLAPSEATPRCTNAEHAACNWLVDDETATQGLCTACAHNETIPNLESPGNLGNWQIMERAKKRLFYALIRFGLPLAGKAEQPETGLAFRFLAEAEAGQPVMTGHANGLITIALVEADDAAREARRTSMGEPYRTLLGHFRHEIAHYYWDMLVANGGPLLSECRAIFGDERADYGEALQRHYAEGAPQGWQQTHVTSYATAHPWEDFAETWAHFFHVVDTLETARVFGLRITPQTDATGGLSTDLGFDPYASADIEVIIRQWVPVSILLNNLNRSVGHADAYPFVLTPEITGKLGFVARLIHAPRYDLSAD